ncbi:MAG TPA: ornithine acetyltransferase [Clostridiales bacterium]|nr:ornithine acetyltransferase [Clostridiales bacterium]
MGDNHRGVTAPKGYTASGVACGIKKNGKKDLALLVSEKPAAVAGMFTKNRVKGHSLKLTMENMKNGSARALLINSGNANACIGSRGDQDAREIAALTASLLCCDPGDVLVGSTGVIGIPMDMTVVREGIRVAAASLSAEGGQDAAQAIMTTDLSMKEAFAQVVLQDKTVTLGGMAKGSGMIHPDMATMIAVITTDAKIPHGLLHLALEEAVHSTFNRITVDGDTSVCDMILVFANGMAENKGLSEEDAEYLKFRDALTGICARLSTAVAKDGEGATKVFRVQIHGAASAEDARKAAMSVACSPLVKTAVHGADANWGRILTAVGYSGAEFDPGQVEIRLGPVLCCQSGAAVPFSEEEALKVLLGPDIEIIVDLHGGKFSDHYLSCDFSEDYVKINGSYRS